MRASSRRRGLSALALLLVGTAGVCCSPVLASPGFISSRALLSSELAIGSSSAMGGGMSVGGPSELVIGSGASTGATNTGDYHEAEAVADSLVDIEADEDFAESESEAHADVYEAVYEEIPYGDGTVDSHGEASGSDFAVTGAAAQVVAVMGSGGSSSFGAVDATGGASAGAGGPGSEASSGVTADGETYNVDIEGPSYASTGSMADGQTSAYAAGDVIAATESELSLGTYSMVDPSAYDEETGVYTTANGIAVIDAWSNAYGAYSESDTETILVVDGMANTYNMFLGPEGSTDADASAGFISVQDGNAIGYGAGSSRSGVSGGIGANLNVKADAGALDSEVPLAIGIGFSDVSVDGELEAFSVGSGFTEADGAFSTRVGALTSADAQFPSLYARRFASTDNVEPDATAYFAGSGYAQGVQGTDSAVLIEGSSSGESFGVALTNLFTESVSDAEAEVLVTSVGDMTVSNADAMGLANAMAGTTSSNDIRMMDTMTAGFDFSTNAAWTQGYGYSESAGATFRGELGNEGYSQASAGAAGAAAAVTTTDLPSWNPYTADENVIATSAVGTAEGFSGGVALGNAATTDINYGSMGGTLARAQSIGDTDTDDKDNSALSATLSQAFILNDNSLSAQNARSFNDIPAAAVGMSSIYTESDAVSETFGADGITYSASDSLTAATSNGAAEGGNIFGSTSLFTESASETGAGTVGVGETVTGEDVLGEAGFATAVGSSFGYGMADVDVPSFGYAEGTKTGIVTLDVVGGSEADSGSLSASNKFVGDLENGKVGDGNTYIEAGGSGEAFGGAAFGHSEGLIVDAIDTSVEVLGVGNGQTGSGTIGLDSNSLATFTALQAGEATGSGSGMASGSFDSPIYTSRVEEGAYGVEGYASGQGYSSTEGSVVGGATDEIQFVIVDGRGSTTGSGSAGIFSEGAVGESDAAAESMGFIIGDAGVGLVGNDPAIREFLPYMAAGAQFISETSLSVHAMAIEEYGEDSYVEASSESATSGNVEISGAPGATVPTIILDPEFNYGVSDGSVGAQGTIGVVTGETMSMSESDILSPGESGKFVTLEVIDEDNTALTGGFADTAMLGNSGFAVGSGIGFSNEREASFPLRGFARVDTEVGAAATDLAAVTAFGIELSDEAPPTISGAFGGAYFEAVAFSDNEGYAAALPGTDLSYEYITEEDYLHELTAMVGQTLGDGKVVHFDNSEYPSIGGEVVIEIFDEDGVAVVEANSDAKILADVSIIAEAAGREAASGFYNSIEESTMGQAVSNVVG